MKFDDWDNIPTFMRETLTNICKVIKLQSDQLAQIDTPSIIKALNQKANITDVNKALARVDSKIPDDLVNLIEEKASRAELFYHL